MCKTPENILTAREAAYRFGVPAKWLKAAADAGRIPHGRAGSVYLFSPAILEAVLRTLAEGRRLARPHGRGLTAVVTGRKKQAVHHG